VTNTPTLTAEQTQLGVEMPTSNEESNCYKYSGCQMTGDPIDKRLPSFHLYTERMPHRSLAGCCSGGDCQTCIMCWRLLSRRMRSVQSCSPAEACLALVMLDLGFIHITPPGSRRITLARLPAMQQQSPAAAAVVRLLKESKQRAGQAPSEPCCQRCKASFAGQL